jgi:hypothetical protein
MCVPFAKLGTSKRSVRWPGSDKRLERRALSLNGGEPATPVFVSRGWPRRTQHCNVAKRAAKW